jgi:hypothetical protein
VIDWNVDGHSCVRAGVLELHSSRAIHVKSALFVLLGALSASLLVLDSPRVRTVLLVGTCVWACARAYYYAFYVIEHYVDGRFRYSGLGSFVRYAVRARRAGPSESDVQELADHVQRERGSRASMSERSSRR